MWRVTVRRMSRLVSGSVLPIVAASALLLGGCNDNCGLGSQLNGVDYDVFAKALEYEIQNEAAFPGEASPANGELTLTFEWGASNEGPITVFMDGQPFEGTGTFDDQECGNFVAQWEGEYLHESGTEHAFAAAGLFMFYDDVLEGQLNYAENFRTPGGKVGAFNVTLGELRGIKSASGGGGGQ